MAKLSDIFPEESGAPSADQRIEVLEKRVSYLEEMVRTLYETVNPKPFVAPIEPPKTRPRRRKQ